MRKLLLYMGAFLFLCLTGCSNDASDTQQSQVLRQNIR